MTTLSKLNQYGSVFQVKVLGALLTQRQFLINIIDSLDAEHFESSAQICSKYDEHITENHIPCEGMDWEPHSH